MAKKKETTNADILKALKKQGKVLDGHGKVLEKHGNTLRNISVSVSGLQVDMENVVKQPDLTEAKSEILSSVDGYKKKVEEIEIEHKTLKNREHRRDKAFAEALKLNLDEIDAS